MHFPDFWYSWLLPVYFWSPSNVIIGLCEAIYHRFWWRWGDYPTLQENPPIHASALEHFPLGPPLHAFEFFQSPVVNILTCNLDELKAIWRVCELIWQIRRVFLTQAAAYIIWEKNNKLVLILSIWFLLSSCGCSNVHDHVNKWRLIMLLGDGANW